MIVPRRDGNVGGLAYTRFSSLTVPLRAAPSGPSPVAPPVPRAVEPAPVEQPGAPTPAHRFTQEVGIDTDVVLVPRPNCIVRSVRCLEEGTGPYGGDPVSEHASRYYQILCVEFDLAIEADAYCRDTRITTGSPAEGPAE